MRSQLGAEMVNFGGAGLRRASLPGSSSPGKKFREEAKQLAMNRIQRIVGNVLINLSGLLLVASGAAKLVNVPKVVSELSSMGFAGNKLLFVAILEIFSAALFWFPLLDRLGSSWFALSWAEPSQHTCSMVDP